MSMNGWRRQVEQLQKQAYVFYVLFKDPRTPWYTKGIAACTTAYLFSPVQLIPSFIPVVGFLDDFLVLFLGAKVIQRITNAELLRECRERAEAAECTRKEKARAGMARYSILLTAGGWLLIAVAGSAFLAAYVYR
jgi:uncharacterized membrane protein YkvA (DUF1232 family)